MVSIDLMNRVFQHYHDRFIVDFMDNILVNTMTKKAHTKHWRFVLQRLKETIVC